MKLLNERPLSQITVKDIVEDCGINRNSFYYHFDDIPTMITEIITEKADEIIAQHASVSSLEECLTAAIVFVKGNKRAVLHIYRSASRDVVEEYLMRICCRMVESYAKTVIGEVPILQEDKEVMIRFFQCECFGQAILWLNSNMNYDIEAQFSRQCEMMDGLIESLIRRCAQDPKRI